MNMMKHDETSHGFATKWGHDGAWTKCENMPDWVGFPKLKSAQAGSHPGWEHADTLASVPCRG